MLCGLCYVHSLWDGWGVRRLVHADQLLLLGAFEWALLLDALDLDVVHRHDTVGPTPRERWVAIEDEGDSGAGARREWDRRSLPRLLAGRSIASSKVPSASSLALHGYGRLGGSGLIMHGGIGGWTVGAGRLHQMLAAIIPTEPISRQVGASQSSTHTMEHSNSPEYPAASNWPIT